MNSALYSRQNRLPRLPNWGNIGRDAKVEKCDTSDGSYADVSGAALGDSIAADKDNVIHTIDLDLTKR